MCRVSVVPSGQQVRTHLTRESHGGERSRVSIPSMSIRANPT